MSCNCPGKSTLFKLVAPAEVIHTCMLISILAIFGQTIPH